MSAISGGSQVWSLRVDIRALDDDGNLCDASALAALCGVLHFRKLVGRADSTDGWMD